SSGYEVGMRHAHLVGVATWRQSLTMPRAPARPKSCETVLKAVRERVGQKHAGQISKRENLRFIVAYAVEIKDDEGDAEKRLKNPLQNVQSQCRIIESVSL